MAEAVVAGDLKAANGASLTKAADAVAVNAMKLSASADGTQWAAVDMLIPGADKYKGTAYKP